MQPGLRTTVRAPFTAAAGYKGVSLDLQGRCPSSQENSRQQREGEPRAASLATPAQAPNHIPASRGDINSIHVV